MSKKDPIYARTKIIIGDLVETKHRGTENAIKGPDLLQIILTYVWPDMPDPYRKMRKICSELPVITGPWGICWPVKPEDIDEFDKYLRSRALALFARAKKVAGEHPELLSERFKNQLNLYEQVEPMD